jgi:hypothetical protein
VIVNLTWSYFVFAVAEGGVDDFQSIDREIVLSVRTLIYTAA